MKLTWKLAFAYAWRHPARMLLTSLAMIASACVVVWVVSGYDAMASKFGDKAQEYLGRYDLFVVPDSTEEAFISPELIAALAQDADIAEFEPVMQTVVRVQSDAGGPGPGMGGRAARHGRPRGRSGAETRHGRCRPEANQRQASSGPAQDPAEAGNATGDGRGMFFGGRRTSSAPTPQTRPMNSPKDVGSPTAIPHSARPSSAISRPNNCRSNWATTCW